MKRNYQRWTIVAAFGASLTVLPVSGCAAPTVAENRLETLKIKPGPKKVVAIYEFRSSVAGVSAASAVDMFTTALVKANAFAVAERARLDQAVAKEKDLQTSGRATGSAGSRKLTGADYVFEATVSESNPGEKASSGGVSLGGLSVGGAGVADSIGLDVRVINAQTGLVIDSINVRKEIKSTSMDFSGLGSLLKSTGFGGSSVTPDVRGATSKKDGVDRALRECIDEAVFKLVQRYAAE